MTLIVIATKCIVTSSSSTPSSRSQGNNHHAPTASPTQLPSTSSRNLSETDGVENSLLLDEDVASLSEFLSQKEFPKNSFGPDSNQQPSSSSLAFLYELYEHEIFNPKSNTWASRRFTQSPTTGGGGRDSTSLDPQSCTPPRNYVFDGEWKIDMADRDNTRDGFGWEYYVGKYDGLGRRRRRWVRSLVRIRRRDSGSANNSVENERVVDAARKKSMNRSSSISTSGSGRDAEKKNTTMNSRSRMQQNQQPQSENIFLLRVLQDQYSFKGFGWSMNKSLIHARAFGTTFRLPLSANFDSYDRYFAAPYISASTYFGYPWVAAALLNASLPVEAAKWIIGGVIWKLQWGIAVLSALTRGVVELSIWVVLWPWRLWMTTFQLMGVFTIRRSIITKQDEDDAKNNGIARDRVATQSADESGDELNVSIETHIEIHDEGEIMSATTSAATAAVIDSPRGGASSITPLSFFAKKHLTMFGNEIPTFHRTTSLAYSSSIQERIGVAVSWRVSRQRGCEYRCNFFFTCMPTRLFWEQVDEERKKHVDSVRRIVSAWNRSGQTSQKSIVNKENDQIEDMDAIRSEAKSISKSRPKSQSLSSALTSFLNDHSSTVGISGGWPMPTPPHFAFNLVLSMSGFYIGWLSTYIRSIFVLPLPKSLHHQSNDEEKLVSSALKNKMPLEADDVDDDIEETDEEEFIANGS